MIIYKDVAAASKDELLSDVYELSSVEDIVWEVKAKMITIKEGDVDIGANPSEEEENEDITSESKTVNNIVYGFRLQETSFDKKSYMVYIKDYMKKISKYLEEKKPDRVAEFQKSAQNYIKKVLANFSDYQFFTGENMDPEGMIVLCIWRDEQPVMIYFKDGLEEMKV